MNAIGAFFSCYISSLALSRCIVQDATGGKTQAVAFVSSSILLIVLLALGPLFEHLPRGILSSIIIVALYGMFVKVKDIKKYYQLSIPDLLIWIVTFLTTVFLGVALGLLAGAGFGMLLIVIRTIVPATMSLGKDDRGLCSYTEDGKKIPGVVIFRFIAPLCYTNAQVFALKLAAACDVDPEKLNISSIQPGCIEVAYYKLRNRGKNSDCHDIKVNQSELQSTITAATGDDNPNTQHNSNANLKGTTVNAGKDKLLQCPDLQYIIIDMSPVTFIDSCGSKTLEKVRSEYSSCGIQLVLAATSKHNMKALEYSGFVGSLGAQWFLPSIQAAVDFINKQKLLNTQMQEPNGSVKHPPHDGTLL